MISSSRLSSSKKRQVEQLLERARLALGAGRMGAFDQVCATIEGIQPGNADVAGLRAFVCIQGGDWEHARQWLEQAIQADPKRTEFYHNLGKLYQNQKLYAEAAEHYRNALRCDPKSEEIIVGYASCLLGQGRAEQALTVLEQISGKSKHSIDTLMEVAVSLSQFGRNDEAMEYLDKVIALAPGNWLPHFEKGLLLMKRGDMDPAIEEFRETISLKPGYINAHANIALIKKYAAANDPDLQAMEALYKTLPADAGDRDVLCNAMGKAYEALKQYDKAFSFYEEGNKLRRKQSAYKLDVDLAHMRALLKFFAPELMGRTSDLEDDRPVFIVGMPRCGSTLVEQILAAHPEVCSRGECNEVEKVFAELQSRNPNTPLTLAAIAAFSPEQWRSIGLDYLRRVDQGTSAKRITDKTLENFRMIGAIHRALPRARIVHVRRQPVDNCMAIYKVLFTNRRHDYGCDLAELGQFYRMYQQVMQHWREVLPAGVMYEMDYEQLVADQEGETRKLLAACGLEWNDACLQFNKASGYVETASLAQIRRPIYSDSVARWKHFEKQLQPLIRIIEGDSDQS